MLGFHGRHGHKNETTEPELRPSEEKISQSRKRSTTTLRALYNAISNQRSSPKGGTALSVIDHPPFGGLADVADTADASDAYLALRAQSGSAEAFATLYDRYRPAIRSYCRGRLTSTDDGDDAAQEAFLRAWRAIDSFGGDGTFGGWLRTIAKNVCTDVLRTRGRTVAVAELDALPATVAPGNVDDALMARSDAALVSTALGRLTDRHREILHMREYTGWTYEHIADHERLELNAVKSLVWRARQALRREVLELAQGAPALLGLVGLLHRLGRRLQAGRLGELQRTAMRLSEAAGQIGAGTAVSAASIAVAIGGPAVLPALPHPAPRPAIVVPTRPDAPPLPFGQTRSVEVPVAPATDTPVGMAGLAGDPTPEPADEAGTSSTPAPIAGTPASDAPAPASSPPAASAAPTTVVTTRPAAVTSTGTTTAPTVQAASTKAAPAKAAATTAVAPKASTPKAETKAAKAEAKAAERADDPAAVPTPVAVTPTPAVDDQAKGTKSDDGKGPKADDAKGEGPKTASDDGAKAASKGDDTKAASKADDTKAEPGEKGTGPRGNELKSTGTGNDDAPKGESSPGKGNGHHNK